MGKGGTPTLVGVLALLLMLPISVKAETILSQTVKTTATIDLGLSDDVGQRLGTGIATSSLYQITVNASWNGLGTPGNASLSYMQVYCYTDNFVTFTPCPGTASLIDNNAKGLTTTPTDYTFTFSSDSNFFRSDRYYVFMLHPAAAGLGKVNVYGSSANTYGGGVCTDPGGTGAKCGTVSDLYFRVFSQASLSNQGISSVITPFSDQVVTSADNVQFSFNYWVDTSQGFYDYVGYTLNDLTTGQSIDTSSATSSIISSGSSVYTDYRDLVCGHRYLWRPYMADATLPRLNGPQIPFYTCTNQSTYVQQGGFFPSTSSPQAWPSFGTTSTSTATNIGNIPNPTFSATSSPWGDILQKKFPFSYFYDLGVIIKELEGASSENGVIGLVPPTLFGVTPTTSMMVIADFNNLPASAAEPIADVKLWIKYGLWIMFAMYAPYMIIRAL